MTCDLETKQVVVAHFLIGISRAHALELHSINVNVRDPLIEAYEDPRARGENYVPRFIRPWKERRWSYPHEDALPLDPRELLEVGWPPDLPDVPRWHYTACHSANWVEKGKTLVFEATEVSKVLAGKPDSSILLSLAEHELNLESEVTQQEQKPLNS